MAHRPPRRARWALAAVKLTLLGVVAIVSMTQPVVSGASSSTGYPVDDRPDRVQRVLDRHDCSTTGFHDGTRPGSAVVRTAAGHLQVVPFDVGWRVYNRHGAAVLIAVCRDQPPTRQRPL